MILITALTAKQCGKCEDAKFILRNYDNINWVDVDSERGKSITKGLNITYTPFFIIGYDDILGITYSDSIIEVRKLIEAYRNK